jgi:hypothetical protein
MYATHGLGEYPNASGPLGLLPLVPIAAIANALGWANDLRLRAGLNDAIIAIFALLLGATAMRIIRRGRGTVEWRLATPCVFLLRAGPCSSASPITALLCGKSAFEEHAPSYAAGLLVGVVMRNGLLVLLTARFLLAPATTRRTIV